VWGIYILQKSVNRLLSPGCLAHSNGKIVLIAREVRRGEVGEGSFAVELTATPPRSQPHRGAPPYRPTRAIAERLASALLVIVREAIQTALWPISTLVLVFSNEEMFEHRADNPTLQVDVAIL
jgi:hypothetical protein